MELNNQLEQLWIQIESRKRHSNILVCVIYQPNFTNNEKDLALQFYNVLSRVNYMWTGMLNLTGDISIDPLQTTYALTIKYLCVLQSYNLHQHTS